MAPNGSARSTPARLQVVDASGRDVPTRRPGAADSAPIDRPDVSVPFFMADVDPRVGAPGVRVVHWTATSRDAAPSGRASAPFAPAAGRDRRTDTEIAVHVERRELAGRTEDVVSGRPLLAAPFHAWHLRVQHGAGSLDAAVSQARRRNLALGFGILSVLGASVALVVVNARRSEQLAAQQLHFVAAVSHELRTPLAVIRSAAENIRAGIVTDPAQADRYGRLIETEGRRLTRMVEQVLAYAGISSSSTRQKPVRPVNVARTIDDAVTSTERVAEEAGCEVRVEVADDRLEALGDEAAIRSAIENLVTNAVKHAADGRFVEIAARVVSRVRRSRSHDRGAWVSQWVEITVSDRGPGVDPVDRPRIFEPFYRGRRAIETQVPGTGLGLSLVRHSIADMGGEVSFDPAPGGGSRFTLRLPAAPPALPPAPAV
jgi:signal transduction histidine kinase